MNKCPTCGRFMEEMKDNKDYDHIATGVIGENRTGELHYCRKCLTRWIK